ncbi:hypothetical protein SAMN03097699_1599 [Flavobacteriaceae bacterium MAR_2010_188]|nr:hypothetical protein SAMN03097699_1599 [Flavobacteriaceae bacterium MAR_2010_188]
MKKSLILILLLSMALIRCQCEPDIKDNERSLLDGIITDTNDNPLGDVTVSLKVHDLNLGKGLTDQNGFFQFISLVSSRNDYSLILKPLDPQSEYSDYKIDFLNRLFNGSNNLGTIPLSKKALLKLQIRNTSNNSASISYSITYRIPECTVSGDDSVSVDYYNCFDTNFYSDRITPAESNLDIEFISILGSTAVLTYTLENAETQLENILLNQSQTNYILEY